MQFLDAISFGSYWNWNEMKVNLVIVCNLFGALLLGLALGYERIYQGRAAGMRTYSLVCLASCALTVFTGYPHYWFGEHTISAANASLIDPTRVIQGIVTGVGFLGAGVIMKEGLTISGLSTAASIWLCSAIGVMVGVGFYAASIALTAFAIGSMLLVSKLETRLPQKKVLFIKLRFKVGFEPNEEAIYTANKNRGYTIAPNSLSIVTKNGNQEWHYLAYALSKDKVSSLATISNELVKFEGIESFELSPVRN